MLFDTRGCLLSQPLKFPSSYGDSAADTSRHVVNLNGVGSEHLSQFFTKDGEIRHPDLIGYVDEKGNPWDERDFSVDQWLALWVACSLYWPSLRMMMFAKLRERMLRVGDGSFINPMMIASIKRTYRKQNWFYDLAFLIQALAFKYLPFRWSDSKTWFESSSNNSGDYLNWFVAGPLFALRTNTFTLSMRFCLKLIPKERVIERVSTYFRDEPNAEFVLNAYNNAIKEVYS